MSGGMADIIAAHQARYMWPGEGDEPMECECGHWRGDVVEVHAAHVAEELAKAGYGNVQEALLSAADEMPIETLQGADKASVWLRQRAHSLDPEGHALVKAIRDRNVGCVIDDGIFLPATYELANTFTIKIPGSLEPLLTFSVNPVGKLDARYDPENLTEAARALLVEVSRLQGVSDDRKAGG